MFKRNFFTITRGRIYGKLINVETAGIIFKPKFCTIMVSKMRTLDGITLMSLEKTDQSYTKEKNLIDNIGKNVIIKYKQDLIGFPWNGEVVGPIHLIDYTIEEN